MHSSTPVHFTNVIPLRNNITGNGRGLRYTRPPDATSKFVNCNWKSELG